MKMGRLVWKVPRSLCCIRYRFATPIPHDNSRLNCEPRALISLRKLGKYAMCFIRMLDHIGCHFVQRSFSFFPNLSTTPTVRRQNVISMYEIHFIPPPQLIQTVSLCSSTQEMLMSATPGLAGLARLLHVNCAHSKKAIDLMGSLTRLTISVTLVVPERRTRFPVRDTAGIFS